MQTKIKRFDDYDEDVINTINNFIKDKIVIDVKQNTVVATTGNFFTCYLVIYKEN